MGYHNQRERNSRSDAASPTKPSPAKKVLNWFKKTVGLGVIAHHRDRPSRRHYATANTRFRGLSFEIPREISDPQDPEQADESKPHFHTTGSKRSVRAGAFMPQEKRTTVLHLLTDHPYSPCRGDPSSLPLHVLIIGASLSGLCLAQGLKRAGIPFTVFEGDSSTATDASDGYHVHIDTSGYEALKSVLPDAIFDLFLQSAGQVFPDTVQLDATTGKGLTAELLRKSQGVNKQVFSVDRTVLRSVLLHGLEEGTEIQYKRVFKRYHVLPNKTVEVHFTNGIFARGAVLVGADGNASRMREQLIPSSTVTSLDTDCCVVYGKTRVTTALATANLASPSTTTLITDVNSKITLRIEPLYVPGIGVADVASEPASSATRDSQRRGRVNTHTLEGDVPFISWALLARTDKFLVNNQMNVDDLHAMAPFQLADVARRMTSSWHPLTRSVVGTQSRAWCTFQRISTSPLHITAGSPSCVTLVGDAAHVILSGGANLALQDAATLCDRFLRMGVGVPAIVMYEKRMRLAARDAVLASVQSNQQLMDIPPVERMVPMARRARVTKIVSR